MLLLHGWGANKESFEGVMRRMQNQFDVIALDLPGFGGSDAPPHAWKIEDFASCVKNFVDKLKLPTCHILGHSFGGQVAMKFARLYPHYVNSLILAGSMRITKKPSLKRRAALLTAKTGNLVFTLPLLRVFRDRVRKKFYRAIGELDYLESAHMKETFKKIIAKDSREDARRITKETLLIWGDKDTTTPLCLGETLLAALPKARMTVLEGCGHYSFLDNPEEFVACVTAFLAS